MFVIVAGLMNIFFPTVAYAGTDIFNNDIQDVYVEITENVDEANDVLQKGISVFTGFTVHGHQCDAHQVQTHDKHTGSGSAESGAADQRRS